MSGYYFQKTLHSSVGITNGAVQQNILVYNAFFLWYTLRVNSVSGGTGALYVRITNNNIGTAPILAQTIPLPAAGFWGIGVESIGINVSILYVFTGAGRTFTITDAVEVY